MTVAKFTVKELFEYAFRPRRKLEFGTKVYIKNFLIKALARELGYYQYDKKSTTLLVSIFRCTKILNRLG